MNLKASCTAALLAALSASTASSAASREAPGAQRFDAPIERLSRAHGVPERLIRRVIMRESKYAPHLSHRGHYGLMQIKLQTAKGMGYSGGASGLLDGETNLTYAVPYLANAYQAGGRNEDRAVALYAGGYYYVAKSKGLIGSLRTARSAPLSGEAVTAYAEDERTEEAPAQAAAVQSASPFAFLFGGGQPAQQMQAEAAGEDANMEPVSLAVAPLPPKRPQGL